MFPVYQALSRELGLRLYPAEPGMMTFAFDLSGELDGHPVRLHRICGRTARFDATSPIVPHLDLGLGITRVGVVSKVSEWFGKRDIQVDDPAFDKAFTIRGDEPDRVRALLRSEVRQAIGTIHTSDFELTDAECSAGESVKFGQNESVENLTYLLRNVVHVARVVGQAHVAVPRATALAAHHDAWSEYARGNQFQFGATPLWMQGKLGKTWVLARASRNRENDFSFELSAQLEQPLQLTLTIRPKQGLIESMVGNQTHATGDQAFDATFDVTRPDRPELVDADLRRGLLALAQLGSVSLHGSHLRLSLPATLAPGRIPALLEELRAVVAVLERNAHGANTAYR